MTIAIDFDCCTGDAGYNWPTAAPAPGTADTVSELMRRDTVYIRTSEDPARVAHWLIQHGLPATIDDKCRSCDGRGRTMLTVVSRPGPCAPCDGTGRAARPGALLVTRYQLPAHVHLGARAVRFTSWEQALTDLTPEPAPEAARKPRAPRST